jgi:hypothetical protein
MGVAQQILAGVSAASDADAEAFITAAVITDATQKSAIRQLVRDLKAASLWTKMHAIYPFVGGSSSSHSYNLKNTATFQITWNGTVTHNANGITPNGTTGWGDTGYNPNTSATTTDAHIAAYSRTSSTAASAEMGVTTSAAVYVALWCKYTDNKAYGDMWKTAAATDEIGVTVTVSQGLFTCTRRSTTDMELYQNGTSLGNSTGTGVGTRPNGNLGIGCLRSSGSVASPSSRNLAFASIGAGLSDSDVSNYYTAVQAFQTTLGRQV